MISNCPVAGCVEGRDPEREAMCVGCWRKVPKDWRSWYRRQPTRVRLVVLIQAVFSAPRWDAMDADEREAVVSYCIKTTRARLRGKPVSIDLVQRELYRHAREGETWKAMADGAVARVFIEHGPGKWRSSYVYRLNDVEHVMNDIRGAIA